MPENPNSYDDTAYAEAADELEAAVAALWAAGASEAANAISNAVLSSS